MDRERIEVNFMEQTREKYKQLGERILSVARNELYLSMRFLDIALGSLSYEMNQNTFFVGTDGKFLYYNARFLMERYQYHPVLVNRAYLHMILHAMFRHIWNRAEREEKLWNMACDIAVESILDEMDCDVVKRLISERREKLYKDLYRFQKVLTAEGIYHYLSTAPFTPQQFVEISTEFLVDDHSFWFKDKSSKSDPQQSDSSEEQQEKEQSKGKNEQKERQQAKQREKQWQKITEQMKTEMETFQKQVGTKQGSFLKSLGVAAREKQNYRSFLQRFAALREEMQIDLDSFDYGFYHFGMEFYGNMPLIEELEYRETMKIQQFVIVVDTSGSCAGQAIEQFLKETFSILKDTDNFFQQAEIHIIQCDQEVQEDICIESQEQLEQYQQNFIVKGYGGTDFRPVFNYVEQLQREGKLKQLKGLLYFTDGYGIYPKKRPPYETVFLFPSGAYVDQTVPPWAIKFILEEERI